MQRLRIGNSVCWRLFYSLIIGLAIGAAQSTTLQAKEMILVRGGSISGLYYQLAKETCAILNDTQTGIDCTARPGLGSIFNINAVSRGLQQFAVAQSDRNWEAVNGAGTWSNLGPVENLRSLFSAHSETVLLVVRKSANIRQVTDLVGKRVNVGNTNSGQRGGAELVLKAYGIDPEQDILAEALQQSDAAKALIEGRIDAFFYTVGNPSKAISIPADEIDIDILSLDADAIKNAMTDGPLLASAMIPAGTYRGVDHDVETVGVTGIVITSAEISDTLVYAIVKAVFENLDRLTEANPAFRDLKPQEMSAVAVPPLHEGAKRYYRERGWISDE